MSNRFIQGKRLDKAFLKIAREDALHEQNGVCKYCFAKLNHRTVTAEHRIAKAKGGRHDKENIAASCYECNTLKGTMTEKRFVKAIKEFHPELGVRWMMAWYRRRINLAAGRAVKNIARYVGLPEGRK